MAEQSFGLVVDFRAKTDKELLEITAARDVRAEKAFAEFYQRHIRYMYFICKRDYANTLGEDGAEDLVQDTFVRAYEKAHTFSDDGITEPDKLALRTHGWLRRIAANLFQDMLRRETSVPTQPLAPEHEEQLADTPSADDEQEPPESAQMKLIKEALSKLSEREQDIVRTVYQWYEKDKKLPSHVIDDLTEKHKTTPENIRKILSRARKKIEEFINAQGTNRAT